MLVKGPQDLGELAEMRETALALLEQIDNLIAERAEKHARQDALVQS